MLQVFSPQILAALDLFSVRSVRENANSNASSNIFYRVDFVLSDVIIYSESYRSGHNEVVLKTSASVGTIFLTFPYNAWVSGSAKCVESLEF